MSRNKVIGVVVDVQVWETPQDLVDELLGDAVIEEIWGDRVDHERIPASEAAPLILQLLECHEHATESSGI